MAALDLAGYVTDLKNHAVDHGLHVHDERHFIETYSLRQAWEIDVHPEEACGGPLDLHLTLEVDPRVLLQFEDQLNQLPPDVEPDSDLTFPLTFHWSLPPLPKSPDLLVVAMDLAGIGGVDFPIELAAADTLVSITEVPERRVTIVGRVPINLARIWAGDEMPCWVFDKSVEVSNYLLSHAPAWLDG